MTAVMQSFNHHFNIILLIIVLKKIILWIFNQLVAQEVFGEISAGYTASPAKSAEDTRWVPRMTPLTSGSSQL